MVLCFISQFLIKRLAYQELFVKLVELMLGVLESTGDASLRD